MDFERISAIFYEGDSHLHVCQRVPDANGETRWRDFHTTCDSDAERCPPGPMRKPGAFPAKRVPPARVWRIGGTFRHPQT